MDGIRLLVGAGSIAAAMIGTLYAAAADGARPSEVSSPVSMELAPTPDAPLPEPIAEGQDVPPEVLALLDTEPGEMIEPETGMRLGPLTIVAVAPVEVEPPPAAAPARRSPTRTARATPRPASVPRLHPDPGWHVIATARRMMARNEVVQGSCYRYLSEVFTRAGHDGWRNRRVVHQAGRNGPYADLDQIRAGDWLYIVNHPERTPVGTHSVLFVSWQDRARGYANVIEHSGWGAPSAGQERSYDVSRTYRILRPTLRR